MHGVDIIQWAGLSGDRPDLLSFPAVTIKQHILHLKLDADYSSTAGRHPVPTARTQKHLHIGGVPGNPCADFYTRIVPRQLLTSPS